MTSTFLKTTAGMNSASIQREVYLKAASGFFDRASAQAEAGDFQAAGSLILKALDQERRAGVVGPQVLQLIKPRS
ncbi:MULTISPECIES: hypothetical protein [Prochlorococcus]|uniref:hypothetical protein n=2 Tax=Prochlorococcaceae TaxID=2881426 RepID=UPI001F1199D3|nr:MULTISPECIES: hypothetical protein [Prochlorococcus]